MKPELPILYSFRRCPYAIRARLAIKVSNIEVQLREVILADKPEEMLACSPKGTVPVLQLPEGAVIDESMDIMVWALAQHDPENWLPSGGHDMPMNRPRLRKSKDCLAALPKKLGRWGW